MNRTLLCLISVVLTILSCEEGDYYPNGLRPYQVEYILTGDDQKTWFLESFKIDGEPQSFTSCVDSTWWSFEVIDSDSISAYQLKFDAQCINFDTTFFGSLVASGEDDFSDSLIFEQTNGSERVMIVSSLTSTRLDVSYSLFGIRYEAYLVPARSGF